VRLELGSRVVDSVDDSLAIVTRALTGSRTVHQAHMPRITFQGPTLARGRRTLFDYEEWPTGTNERRGYQAYGRFQESYRKIGGDWKIAGWRVGFQRARIRCQWSRSLNELLEGLIRCVHRDTRGG
jgi:SnoaL-like domain